jgi:predicted MPP superfamily phosphohydrolase
MRTVMFIVFFGIFFVIMGSISLYIFVRGLQSIPADSSLRHAYSVVFWTVALSFMGGRLLERFLPSILANLLIWMGSFWIAAMLYFLIAIASLDLLRLVHHFIPFFPSAVTGNYAQAKYITLAGVTGLVGFLLLAGHINAMLPRVRELSLSTPQKAAGMKDLDIVAASDIHLGTIVGRSHLDQIVDKINSLDPDLVLLPGDIVDEDLAPVIKQNLGESLRKLRTRLGVYAVTGNHEYIGGVEEACAYLTEHNITMLRDQSVKVGDSIYIVGREDRSMNRFAGGQRKSLAELMAAVDRSYPVILMDHQPFGLDEAAGQGIDLQLSGHTHAGQLWPINYIVDSIYELAWGYKKTAGTHFYVSNGVGTWGPPLRLGNRPEIVRIRIHFE